MRSNPPAFPSVTDSCLLSHEHSHEMGEFVDVAANLFAIFVEKNQFQIISPENFSATRAENLKLTTGLFNLKKIAVFNECCCKKATFSAPL